MIEEGPVRNAGDHRPVSGLVASATACGPGFRCRIRQQTAFAGRVEVFAMKPTGRYMEKLIASLRHEDPTIRRRAAWLLGKLKEKSAVLPLLHCLMENGNDPYILADAALALGEIGDRQATAHLIFLLQHNSFLPARLAAVEALGRLGGNRAREALTEALKDQNQVVRIAAAEALHALDFKNSVRSKESRS